MGQRVNDILAVLEAFPRYEKVALAAYGPMCVPALCAAALSARLSALYLAGGLLSWTSILTTDEYKEPFSNFVPGVLRQTDLPQIAEAIPKQTRLILAGTVNGSGQRVPAEAVQRLYPGAVFQERADWTEAAIGGLLA